ncbi:MAG: primosomal protein N' [Ectothiorhodospiraceae bacterium]|nr:primosomal protein N' [Ectothiorhodospiraceae bacterium]
MFSSKTFLHLAVPSPLRRGFDYLPPTEVESGGEKELLPGIRVRVSFGRTTVIALVLEVKDTTDVPANRLKSVQAVLDDRPLFSPTMITLLKWAGAYYQHPIGEVVSNALPGLLRQDNPEALSTALKGVRVWQLSDTGRELDPKTLSRAPRQVALHQLLANASEAGLVAKQIDTVQTHWRPVMAKLVVKALVQVSERSCLPAPSGVPPIQGPKLNDAQAAAVEHISKQLGRFAVSLVDGVTGSGKTEVYLSLIDNVLARDEQVLVLVPEIGLTPQLLTRFRARFAVPIAVLHSGLSDRERLCAWQSAREGDAPIVIGTRSAVFTPLPRLGLIILDEEHDISFKQQEGFRYSARDVAIKRAHFEGLPVVLGTATPSLESLHNAQQGRYSLLLLRERAGAASHPDIAVLDVRKQPMFDGLSSALVNAMRRHLDAGGQVLVFLNRRGYAPTMLCHDCGWVAKCQRCDANMTLFNRETRLRCHHCGCERPAAKKCPDCESTELRPVGAGTERLEQALRREFPETGIIRIDRDTTRRKGAMQSLLESVHDGTNRILVGTQMLAKGHHFPDVTLVGIVDIDQGLFSADFRATERMAQLIVQVAGRAGRAEKPGQVLIQTHHPDHPLLQVLLHQGYAAFANAALEERRLAQLAPHHYMALLRAEAVDEHLPLQFLEHARQLAEVLTRSFSINNVQLLGPVPAPMERRAGRVRAQLLLQTAERAPLHHLLEPWLQQLERSKLGRKVRWSIDVDPQEMF